MKRILRRFGYFNVIESPTRITASSKSLIDLIIVSPNLQASNVLAGSIDLGISDRHLIFAAFSTRRSNSKPKLITVRNYKDMDNEKLQSTLEEAPWHIVSAVEDVEDSVYLWETMFKDIIESNIKRRNVKVRHKSLPWNNTEIRKATNQRYKCLKAAQEVKAQNISNTSTSKSLGRNETIETTLSTPTSSHNTKEVNSTSSPKNHLNHTNVVTFNPTSGSFHPTSGGMVTDGMLQRSLYVSIVAVLCSRYGVIHGAASSELQPLDRDVEEEEEDLTLFDVKDAKRPLK
ncbi:hypothetical protein AWC38_SpisGene4831 [Stylophora pistillata]|uniref:Uncharacterized protein n=1 Tax=Stylophora pistillata TaxID=50429 RepID=A0A2B4SMM8_STYPI|nr:hypothetical protein AWC38_SpisGene4831 [Stylophora pistillata]